MEWFPAQWGPSPTRDLIVRGGSAMGLLKSIREVAEVVNRGDDLQWLLAEPARVPIADAAVEERQRQLREMPRSFLKGKTL